MATAIRTMSQQNSRVSICSSEQNFAPPTVHAPLGPISGAGMHNRVSSWLNSQTELLVARAQIQSMVKAARQASEMSHQDETGSMCDDGAPSMSSMSSMSQCSFSSLGSSCHMGGFQPISPYTQMPMSRKATKREKAQLNREISDIESLLSAVEMQVPDWEAFIGLAVISAEHLQVLQLSLQILCSESPNERVLKGEPACMECEAVDQAPPRMFKNCHEIGCCKPCFYLHRPEGCGDDRECGYCHECPENEIRRRKKLLRILRRYLQQQEIALPAGRLALANNSNLVSFIGYLLEHKHDYFGEEAKTIKATRISVSALATHSASFYQAGNPLAGLPQLTTSDVDEWVLMGAVKGHQGLSRPATSPKGGANMMSPTTSLLSTAYPSTISQHSHHAGLFQVNSQGSSAQSRTPSHYMSPAHSYSNNPLARDASSHLNGLASYPSEGSCGLVNTMSVSSLPPYHGHCGLPSVSEVPPQSLSPTTTHTSHFSAGTAPRMSDLHEVLSMGVNMPGPMMTGPHGGNPRLPMSASASSLKSEFSGKRCSSPPSMGFVAVPSMMNPESQTSSNSSAVGCSSSAMSSVYGAPPTSPLMMPTNGYYLNQAGMTMPTQQRSSMPPSVLMPTM